MPECTIQARAVLKILDAVRRAEVRSGELFDTVKLDTSALDDPEARIPYHTLVTLYEQGSRLTGDDAFGLHLAERITPQMFDVVGYAAMNSPTLGEALMRVIRYDRIWTDGSKYRLEREGPIVRILYEYTSPDPKNCRQECEASLAGLVCVGRSLTGVRWTPLEVNFKHPCPGDTSEHGRIFGAPVRFLMPANEMVLDRQLLDQPLVKADLGLCAVLDRHATEMLDGLPRQVDLIARLRRTLAQSLRGGSPGVEALARELGMSTRTLQRRLSEEGTSYHRLLEDLRHDLSRKYLLEPGLATGEVAYLLGFSEPSAFHRAFRQWTGMTPGDYRQRTRRT
ncbi:MAG: AraC family transcriptional regulator [Acidobacteriia bacterium]|nr:AraC family transcriptional regulator [Terriglobia bacterium]